MRRFLLLSFAIALFGCSTGSYDSATNSPEIAPSEVAGGETAVEPELTDFRPNFVYQYSPPGNGSYHHYFLLAENEMTEAHMLPGRSILVAIFGLEETVSYARTYPNLYNNEVFQSPEVGYVGLFEGFDAYRSNAYDNTARRLEVADLRLAEREDGRVDITLSSLTAGRYEVELTTEILALTAPELSVVIPQVAGQNQFRYGQQEMASVAAYLQPYDDDGQLTSYRLYITDSELSYDNTGRLAGRADLMLFELKLPSGDVPDGTYMTAQDPRVFMDPFKNRSYIPGRARPAYYCEDMNFSTGSIGLDDRTVKGAARLSFESGRLNAVWSYDHGSDKMGEGTYSGPLSLVY